MSLTSPALAGGSIPLAPPGKPCDWVKVKVKSLSHVWLCDPMDCSLPGSSIQGIFQARILEWVAISLSRGSSWPRDRTQVSRIVGRRFTIWAAVKDLTVCFFALFCEFIISKLKKNQFIARILYPFSLYFHFNRKCPHCIPTSLDYFKKWTKKTCLIIKLIAKEKGTFPKHLYLLGLNYCKNAKAFYGIHGVVFESLEKEITWKNITLTKYCEIVHLVDCRQKGEYCVWAPRGGPHGPGQEWSEGLGGGNEAGLGYCGELVWGSLGWGRPWLLRKKW